MGEQKRKFAWWVSPSTLDLIGELYRGGNCKSKAEFIEKAVLFYSGYLAHGKNKAYLPQVLVSTFRGMLDSYEDRQAALLFKLAVEIAMMDACKRRQLFNKLAAVLNGDKPRRLHRVHQQGKLRQFKGSVTDEVLILAASVAHHIKAVRYQGVHIARNRFAVCGKALGVQAV